MKFLVLILRNMRRQQRRTVLSILTIAVATLVFAMLLAVPSSMDRLIEQAARGQRLFVQNRAGPYGVPAKYCRDIKKIAHASNCAAELDVWMLYRNDHDWVGVAAADLEILDTSPNIPASADEVSFLRRDKRACAVGPFAMKRYGWHPGQQIMLRYNGNPMPFIIAGPITDESYPNVFLMRRDYLVDTAKAQGQDLEAAATRLMVRVDTADNVGQVARTIDENYRNAPAETRTQSESEFLASNLANVGNIRAIIFSLIAVVLLTVLLVSGNSMAMTVRDRIPEVALLRTLGFGRVRIGYLLFGEACLLGLIGGAIGSAGALALFAAGMNLGAVTNGLGLIAVTAPVAAVSLAAAVAVAILSGTIPVAGALSTPPAIALRKIV